MCFKITRSKIQAEYPSGKGAETGGMGVHITRLLVQFYQNKGWNHLVAKQYFCTISRRVILNHTLRKGDCNGLCTIKNELLRHYRDGFSYPHYEETFTKKGIA